MDSPELSLSDRTGSYMAQRKKQLRRYVQIVMIACVAIFLLGGARAAASALSDEGAASPPAAREAMTAQLGSTAEVRLATPSRHLAKSAAAAKTRAKAKSKKRGR